MEGASVRVVWRKNLAGVEGTLWILHSTQRMRIPYEIELQFCMVQDSITDHIDSARGNSSHLNFTCRMAIIFAEIAP